MLTPAEIKTKTILIETKIILYLELGWMHLIYLPVHNAIFYFHRLISASIQTFLRAVTH